MKKILIILSLIFLANSMLISRNIEINKGGEGQGYTVNERHTDGGWFSSAKSTLNCTAPGPAECVWNINPLSLPEMVGPNGSTPEFEDLQNYAESQISQGVLTGNYTNNVVIQGDHWLRSVSWNATDINHSNILISINLAPIIP